jgi:hypothetical protein
MAGNDEDGGRSRRFGVEEQGSSGTSQVLSGRTIEKSGDDVCDPQHTRGGDKKSRFFGLASKLVVTVC